MLIGHKDPDEDCYASVASAALLLRKFNKHVSIFLETPPPENLNFINSLCKYNKVNIYYGTMPPIRSVQVVGILDTPKPDMIAADGCIYDFLNNPEIPNVELDHHFSSDAAYSGDPAYSLVLHASSTCEILCRLCYKLANHPEIMRSYSIEELYSRNLVLALLTGMLGDAKMGNYLATKHDRDVFDYFSKHLNLEATDAETQKIYNQILDNAVYNGRVGTVMLSETDSLLFFDAIEYSQFVGMIKVATNAIAEKSGGVGISVYHDAPGKSDKIQCRIRAAQAARGIDLHPVLSHFKITDGGGHPGAIAFRLPRKLAPSLPVLLAEIETFIRHTILYEDTSGNL